MYALAVLGLNIVFVFMWRSNWIKYFLYHGFVNIKYTESQTDICINIFPVTDSNCVRV